MVPAGHYLILGAVLFGVGAAGVLLRRSAVAILMCIELMLNGVNLTLVTFSRQYANFDGQIAAFLVMTVAAAEAAVGLALIVALWRRRGSVDVEKNINLMKW
ncbi:MAG: NADH-quinone oxidoreductase subunit NuoK [Pseudomonadota bacterium]